MPYVSQQSRLDLHSRSPQTAGELNYVITTILLEYVGEDAGYADFNEVIGALECCKMEFYRRACAPYEDHKANENGDVYYGI